MCFSINSNNALEFSLPYRLRVFPSENFGVVPPVQTWSFPSYAPCQILEFSVFPVCHILLWSFPSRIHLEFSLPNIFGVFPPACHTSNNQCYGVFPPVYIWSFPSRTFWSFPSHLQQNKNINLFLRVELCIYIAFNIF